MVHFKVEFAHLLYLVLHYLCFCDITFTLGFSYSTLKTKGGGDIMETSFYIIKPHGLMFRDKIRAMIEAGGLIITESKRLVLPDWALKIIYSDLPEKYRDAVFQSYKGAFVEVGLVIGEDAIDKLLRIAGTELDPVDCAHGTIRSTFGGREPFIIDGVRCYANIIHRSRNKMEAEKDIEIFHAL